MVPTKGNKYRIYLNLVRWSHLPLLVDSLEPFTAVWWISRRGLIAAFLPEQSTEREMPEHSTFSEFEQDTDPFVVPTKGNQYRIYLNPL